MKRASIARIALYIFLLVGSTNCVASKEVLHRNALVIGNSNYLSSPLKNPVNDANDMAALLQAKGFTVLKLINANKKDILNSINQFSKRLKAGGGVGLFYYAGHGVEVSGNNYLIPIAAEIENENDIEFESINMSRIITSMGKTGNDLNLIILDACRNNPYQSKFRGISSGLVRMNSPRGSLLLYATSPGEVALDGAGANGLFTKSLMTQISMPNLKVEDVFKETAKDVYKATKGKQMPWASGVIINDFYFNKNVLQDNSSARLGVDRQNDILFWESIRNKNDLAFYKSYIKKFPSGIFSVIAKLEINKLANKFIKKTSLTINANPIDAKIRILNIRERYKEGIQLPFGKYLIEIKKIGFQRYIEWIALENVEMKHTVSLNPELVVMPKTKLKDIQDSLEMVVIPKGCFQIGSPNKETGHRNDERKHRVCVDEFQMGAREVTVGEFKSFIEATGYRLDSETIKGEGCFKYEVKDKDWILREGSYWDKKRWGLDEFLPVTCVSWNDIQNYIDWLNSNSLGGYRLPTEAEWEYAARSGTDSMFFWTHKENNNACHYGNINDSNWLGAFECNDNYEYLSPVGRFLPNSFGLYDITGNVWEMTCSRYDKTYSGSERHCVERQDLQRNALIVIRGGSAFTFIDRLRLAERGRTHVWMRMDNWGFRLARDP